MFTFVTTYQGVYNNKEVAVKEIRTSDVMSQQMGLFVEELRSEIAVMKSVRNPFAINVLGCVGHDGTIIHAVISIIVYLHIKWMFLFLVIVTIISFCYFVTIEYWYCYGFLAVIFIAAHAPLNSISDFLGNRYRS